MKARCFRKLSLVFSGLIAAGCAPNIQRAELGQYSGFVEKKSPVIAKALEETAKAERVSRAVFFADNAYLVDLPGCASLYSSPLDFVEGDCTLSFLPGPGSAPPAADIPAGDSIRLIQQLGAYVSLLGKLATGKSGAELVAAFKRLEGTIKTVTGSGNSGLSDSESALLKDISDYSGFIRRAGALVDQTYRAKVLRDLTTKYDPLVQESARTIIAVLRETSTYERKTVTPAFDAMRSARTDADDASDPAARRESFARLQEAHESFVSARNTSPVLTVAQIATLHAAATKALAANPASADVATFAALVADLNVSGRAAFD